MDGQSLDYRKKWYSMAAVGMGVFLATVDGSIVNIALPTMVPSLQTDFAVVQWVVLSYLLTVTTLMVSIGRLADMIGRKALYTVGFVVFTCGSVLCGLSPDIWWLIGFRVVQAVGAALIMALGAAIVTEAFPASERGKAIGVIGAVVSVGISVGPTLGGLILEYLSWPWIFYVNLPSGIVGTLMVIKFVPVVKPAGGQKFDYWGGLTMFVGLLVLLLGLTMGQRVGFGQAVVWLCFAVFLFCLVLFIIIEWKTVQPMIPLSFFKNGLFSLNLTNGFIVFIGIGGISILLPFYLINVLQFDKLQVGLLMCVVPVTLGITAPISGILSDRLGSRPITVVGLAILLISYYAASTLTEHTTALGYILRMLPLGIGMGIFQSPNNSAIMGAVPRRNLGIASGMLSITRTLGQTTGVAVLGAIWAAQTLLYAGRSFSGRTTEAPAAAQVAALQDTILLMVVPICLGLAFCVWSWLKHSDRWPETLPESRSSKPSG